MNKWSQDSHPGLPDSLCPAHACAHAFSVLPRSQMGLGSSCTIPPAQDPPYTHFTLAWTPACWGFGLQSPAPSAWGLWASKPPSFASEGGDNESPASCEEHRWSCRCDAAPLLLVQTWHRIHPRSVRDGEVMKGWLNMEFAPFWSDVHPQLCVASWAPGFPFHGLWARFPQRKLSLADRLISMSAMRKACCLYLWSTHGALLCISPCCEGNKPCELGSLPSVLQLARAAFHGLQPTHIQSRALHLPFLLTRLRASLSRLPVFPLPPFAHLSPPV